MKNYLKRILKAINGRFTYSRSFTLNKRRFRIPLINNMGLLNLRLKNDDWLPDILQRVSMGPHECMIDVGVNVGQSLLVYRSLCDNPYWGFEPNPACVFYLENLISRNEFRDIHIIPVGLSGETALARFFRKHQSDSAGTVVSGLRPGHYREEESSYVPLFSFEMIKLPINSVALVKIDVEGGEFEVLQGLQPLLRREKPPVVCEILDSHDQTTLPAMQARADKLITLVKELGYKVYRISKVNAVLRLDHIEHVTLTVWTPDSYFHNDYLFVHPANARGL
jgi:FkbM family methyltransferase